MEVFALLFASKYGMAALGVVTLAASMLVGSFLLLSQKASNSLTADVLRTGNKA